MATLGHTLLPANLLLALVGILVFVEGVWRFVDQSSSSALAEKIINDTILMDKIKEVPRLEDAIKEATTHSYLTFGLLCMGPITVLVALVGSCPVKKGSTWLLTTYSFCIVIIILLQIGAIILINIEDDNIEQVKTMIKEEAVMMDMNLENLRPGSKFIQSLFFGASTGNSLLLLFLVLSIFCRTRRDEREILPMRQYEAVSG